MARRIATTIIIFCALSTEGFAPSPSIPVSTVPSVTKLDATNGSNNMENVAKTVVASALTFSLLFGPTPALADGMSHSNLL